MGIFIGILALLLKLAYNHYLQPPSYITNPILANPILAGAIISFYA